MESSNNNSCKRIGTFPCGLGDCCASLECRIMATLSGERKWKSRHFVDCDTIGIVCLLQCLCGAFYVGKTHRPFKRRIYNHKYAGSIGYLKSPLGRYIAFSHNYKFEGFRFLPLERIHIPSRGVNWENIILRVETKWIFKLKAYIPPGLNESILYKPFL